MKPYLFLTLILLLSGSRLFAQTDINPSDASRFIGKAVRLDGFVTQVIHRPHSNIISFGISDDDYKSPQSLVIIIHLKHFDSVYYRSLKALTGKEINTGGVLQSSQGLLVINHYGHDLYIEEIERLPSY